MFGFFKKKEKALILSDLEDQRLVVGDRVMALRYELGEAELIEEDGMIFYRSLETGKKVEWFKMIDASTEKQKVKKLPLSK